MVERIGLENVFVHLDTYHMNIEEKGVSGIRAARNHLRIFIYLNLIGDPGMWNLRLERDIRDAAIEFRGGMAMESFINMPPELSYGLSVWRPVATGEDAVMNEGLPS